MWQKVASKLRVDFSGWQIAETRDFKTVYQVLNDAKKESLFIGFSDPAGKGKSAPQKVYSESHAGEAVFFLRAREWARKEFLDKLRLALGIEVKGVLSIDALGEKIIQFFQDRASSKPLLIIDEADKLKAPAIRFFIHLYNELEDKLGLVMFGTENLEKQIKAGVRLKRKGYDEIDSRFGRKYLKLMGCTKDCLRKICEVNGIRDKMTMSKIWNECKPISKTYAGQSIKVLTDLRRVKRSVIREKLNQSQNQQLKTAS